jgi:hypothetical protein
MNKCAVMRVSLRPFFRRIKMADHSIAAAAAADHSIGAADHSRAMDHSIAGTERRTPGMVRREGSPLSDGMCWCRQRRRRSGQA